MTTRVRVFFSGTVQGVGFRYAVTTVARNFDITGWVRNLSDGRVEVLAEGLEEVLKSFVQEVEYKMSGYVSQKRITWESASGEFVRFAILPTL